MPHRVLLCMQDRLPQNVFQIECQSLCRIECLCSGHARKKARIYAKKNNANIYIYIGTFLVVLKQYSRRTGRRLSAEYNPMVGITQSKAVQYCAYNYIPIGFYMYFVVRKMLSRCSTNSCGFANHVYLFSMLL